MLDPAFAPLGISFAARRCKRPRRCTAIQIQPRPLPAAAQVNGNIAGVNTAETERDTILIVDDDREIRDLLRQVLQASGLRPLVAADGREMRLRLQEHRVDLVVLDLMLPGEDGLSLCRWLRDRTQTPVIMLTALGSATDRIVGLEVGADDYLPKPFEPRELLARIRAVLRRARALPRDLAVAPSASDSVHFAGWTLNHARRELQRDDGLVVPLSGVEYRLLKVFVTHPQVVLSRERLTEMAHGRELQAFERSIDIQVSRLRQRLHDSDEPRLLKTVRSGGYVLAATVQPRDHDA
jgi:two-component system OmpR family response regulator